VIEKEKGRTCKHRVREIEKRLIGRLRKKKRDRQ
jgi:hypothetical protein